MSQFAKLFEFADIGQVLVKKDTGETQPEIRFYFQPQNLGICSIAINFHGDTDEAQWEATDSAFDILTETQAYEIVCDALQSIPEGLCA